MTYALYQNINQLEDTAFIAGSNFTFIYNIYEADGITPVDISGSSVKVRISPYGQPDYNVLTKTGNITGTGIFRVTLTATDTQNLAGKYTQQIWIQSFSGIEYRPAQGVILIIPRIVT